MKIYEILIIFCLISFIYSICEIEEGEDETRKIRDKDDCTKRTFTEEEAYNGGYRCCMMKKKMDTNLYEGDIYSCIAVSSAQYDDIKNFVKEKEKEQGVKKVKINCKSSYLHFGIIIFILLLF